MNSTIETILNHRSIRLFKEEKLTTKQIQLLVQSAQQASTSSNVMAYTIIGISDKNVKEELKEISGHKHVINNGHLFIFCGDLHRVQLVASDEVRSKMMEMVESTEQFIVANIDAALAAQNLSIAAESMGLGICFLGSLRNNIERFSEILKLPEHVIPLFGIAVGYPDHKPEIKPRLPIDAVYHENQYPTDDKLISMVAKYDEEIKAYYQTRSTNRKVETWTEQMIQKYSNSTRLDVADFTKKQKLNNQ
ncbi:oxygen-insensitive NADPH nitroreductase [Oceanobacillus bengalensis]|uniref:Oxygen-insensitive NADPH nitroreductase n=1 Tax=Oceanobacillus bengalensis TaxID=1435466 RepID=A0A494Z2Z0_9BACI|nr:oxygen-insensitive NADPH nitroreductase [Oceanobacillus bengalensis]RKQ16381.1 oxygen-insensitive NADPH nitroreductase [Oceanobacillus bengalensis]